MVTKEIAQKAGRSLARMAAVVAVVAFTVWYVLIFRDYRRITRALVLFSRPLYIYVISAVITAPTLRWARIVSAPLPAAMGTNSL